MVSMNEYTIIEIKAPIFSATQVTSYKEAYGMGPSLFAYFFSKINCDCIKFLLVFIKYIYIAYCYHVQPFLIKYFLYFKCFITNFLQIIITTANHITLLPVIPIYSYLKTELNCLVSATESMLDR
jgi:hypothetical protein